MKLLSRDDFREGVFKRDNNKCVVCNAIAVDAHHIIERKLFDDGGYYLNNGVSLCDKCHIKAESTEISCDDLRKYAGINEIVLPQSFSSSVTYDKWGNVVLSENRIIAGDLYYNENVQRIIKPVVVETYVKYPRTPHLRWSEKASDDDEFLDSDNHFIGKEVVVSVKMDGENTNMYPDRLHARSIDSDNHPSRNWVKGLWGSIKHEIPAGWRICGENLYAYHTIKYENLSTFFYVFSIWDNNQCLSWDDTVTLCSALNLTHVPVIYRGIYDEEKIKALYQPTHNGDPMEGYVVRLASSYRYDQFKTSVAKYVSKSFQIDNSRHWMTAQIIPNKIKE